MYSAHSVGISISSGVSDLGPDGLPKLFNEALLEPVLARRPSSRDGVLGGNFSSTSRPSSRASSARKSRNPIDEADALERYLEKSGTRKEFNLQQYLETTADPPIIPQTTEGMGMNEAMVSYRPSSRGASPSVNTRKLQSKKSASKLIEEIDDLLQNPLYTNDIALNYKSLLLPLRQPKGIRGSLLVQYPSPKQKMVRHTLANSQDPLDDQLMHMMMQQQQYDQQQQQYRQDVYAHPDAQSKYESTEVVGIAGQIQYFPGSSQAVPKLKMNANKVGSFRFINGNIKLLADILQYNGMEHVVGNKEAGLIWCCHHIRGHAISNLPPFHKINIFPHSYECTKKDSLARNINNLIQIHGRRHFSFMPECYVWPQEKDMIKRAMEASSRQQPPTSKSSRKSSTAAQRPAPWILKPAGSSQGKGISILQHFNEISEHIEDEESIYIIERYIHNPLLIQEKKFDLRIYVLVTSFDPLKIYIHKEGLVRRASEKYSYDEETLKNKFCHLTNYSINKKHPGRGAGKQQEGNPGENGGVDDHLDNDGNNDQYGLKMTFADLQTWMHSQGFQDTDRLWAQIEDLIIKTLIVAEGKINAAISTLTMNPDCCFELFGFDVLIDDQYQPWLMEVNFAPSLTADSALDYTVKSKVLVDMLNIAGIRKSPSAATTVPTATSKVPVKKHMHASYVANILNSATSNTANNSNITNDDLIRFHFHGDYEHRDAYTSAVTDFPEEADTGGDEIDDFVKQMEKLVWTQFKDELSQGIEKKMIMQFLQERQRVMRSNNQFKLIYPIEEKYSQYQKFFSVDRLNNEILGRFVFFLHQYSQLNQPVSNEDLAMTSTQSKKIKKTKSVSKTKKKLLLHTIYSQQYAGLYQRPSSATSRNVKADSTVPSTTTKEDHEHHALPPKAKARPHSAVKSSSNSNFHVSHQFQESQSNNSSKLPTPRNHPHDQSHEDNTPDDDNEHVAKGQVDEQQLHQPVQYEFKVDMWNQIHNRWARAMGRSTATSRR